MSNLEEHFKHYQDRGMVKWAGFYLSEHSAQMERAEAFDYPEQHPRMSQTDIEACLEKALTKDLQIRLQKEEVDLEGHYRPDLVGKITGYDEEGLYIARQQVRYDEIRFVQIEAFHKWSETGAE